MAPKKRKTTETANPDAARPSQRVTRSSTRNTGNSTGGEAAPPVQPVKPPTKKAKASKEKEERKPSQTSETEPLAEVKTIIVEACKQCHSFKVRALKVKDDLEKAVPGIVVEVNPERPRKGCFEIRDGSGKIFISLLDMPRPFKKMKDLDMDQVISDIIEKIK
ncbi:uncharacterized protein LOC143878375 [Tasmannia lanceolata]|uniref:uncharacterized protein LOC143878375 n=1 Tax=Tasmannia lanceolata TaxID=3420 RepID=UPI0040641C12